MNNTEDWSQALSQETANMQSLKTEIEEQLLKFNSASLLAQVSLASHFGLFADEELRNQLQEIPILYFLTGVSLAVGQQGSKTPSWDETREIITLIERYYFAYQRSLIFQALQDQDERSGVLQSAKSLKLIRDINPEGYWFQYLEFISEFFNQFEQEYEEKVGFSPRDAWNFAGKIIDRYEKVIAAQASIDDASSSAEALLPDGWTTHPLIFQVDQFCDEEQVEDESRFQNYLQALSCRFGDEKLFSHPLDESIAFTKPIIQLDDKTYFVPLLNYLLYHLPQILERLLEDEKQKNSRLWIRYSEQKKEYLERKTYEYFCRIFPPEQVFRNLHYEYKGEDIELDILIVYDNKIIIVEAKSGNLTSSARRGAPARLATDLKKLINDAYGQARRTKEFISSSETATFTDQKKQPQLTIKSMPNEVQIYLVNITLEPLLNLAIALGELEVLGLFGDGEYVWSVNLRELDIVTQHLLVPSRFLHYLEKRTIMSQEKIYDAMDELSLLAWYLEKGNFYPRVDEDGKTFDKISLDGWVDSFDDYYLRGVALPQIEFEEEFVEIIKFLERKQPQGYTDMINLLLDFPNETREKIISQLRTFVAMTKKKFKQHDFSYYSGVTLSGITVVTGYGRKSHRTKTVSGLAEINKYRHKAKKWIGIIYDTSLLPPYLRDVYYYNSDWEFDEELERLSKLTSPKKP